MVYRDKNNQDVLDREGNVISRTCKGCGEHKDIGEFYKANSPKHRRRKCKTCVEEMRVANLSLKPDGWEEHKRKSHLRKKYGITLETFYELLEAQGELCRICSRLMDSTTRKNVPNKVQVDHDHATGEVRGLLCFSCNTGLGKFGDSVELLQKAIHYLENPPNVTYRDKFLGVRERHHAKFTSRKMVEDSPEDIPKAVRSRPHRLTPEEKDLIREEYLTGEVTQRYLGIRWGVHPTTISMITTSKVTSEDVA